MYFSAAKLVKSSAAQMVYIELRNICIKANGRQKRGNNYADNMATNRDATERRGTIKDGGDVLFFCIDMVRDNTPVEIKMVEGIPELWYLQSSLVQSAYYAALLSRVDYLDTPKFRQREGVERYRSEVPTGDFELWFGDDKYVVSPSQQLLDHYTKKMQVVRECVKAESYNAARAFDHDFKHKEFSLMTPTYKAIR